MKETLDRLYATLAHVHGLISAKQLEEAYDACLRGEAPSVLQALADRGLLTEADRGTLDRYVRACLAKTADALLLSRGASNVRQRLRNDPACRDDLAERFPGLDTRGRFRLLELVGEGGMGRVWLARDEVLERTVALKELRPERAERPDARARLIREAQITGRLEHPFIVPIHELQSDGGSYYAMRLVRGETFAEAIAAHHAGKETWDLRRLLAVFVQVCQAIAFAHSHGVVHRDLKPANIVLGNFGEVFVLDWGLARDMNEAATASTDGDVADSADARTTRAGQVLGTPAYMSPEQAAGRSQDAGIAVDIFGLGGILFEILTGQAPQARHASLSGAAMLARIAAEPVPPARAMRPQAPAALEAIGSRALAYHPEARYGSALELAEDVRRWTLGEPVSVYREPWSLRARRWALAHRRLTLMGAATAMALACALVAFAVAGWRDGAAIEARTCLVLETRAGIQRTDLLADVTYLHLQNQDRAQSLELRQLIEDPANPGNSRRRLAERWVRQMQNRPYLLALALVDRRDPASTWVRAQRDAAGEAPRFLIGAKELDADARKALQQTLVSVQQGVGPHFARADSRANPANRIDLVLVTPMEIEGHDAWLVSQFDFTAMLQKMANPYEQHDITVVMRNRDGKVLAAEGDAATIAVYGGERLDDRLDARLRQFFARDDSARALNAWTEWKRTQEIPPIDPAYRLTLTHCRPNNDIVHAYKVHYNPQMPDHYLGVIMVAPYERFLEQSVAGRHFLLVLMVLSGAAVFGVVLLAFRLFAPPPAV